MAHKICPACGVEIYFLATRKGGKMPVRASLISEVDQRIMQAGGTVIYIPEVGHKSHFLDCTEPNRFHKGKK